MENLLIGRGEVMLYCWVIVFIGKFCICKFKLIVGLNFVFDFWFFRDIFWNFFIVWVLIFSFLLFVLGVVMGRFIFKIVFLLVILFFNIGLICKLEKLVVILIGWKFWFNWELIVNLVVIFLNFNLLILVILVVLIFFDINGLSKFLENLILVFIFFVNKGLIFWIWLLICCNCCLVFVDVVLFESKLIFFVVVLNKVLKEIGKIVFWKLSLIFFKFKFFVVFIVFFSFKLIFL